MWDKKEDRFQNQPWHIKLWRLRWMLYVPYEATHSFISCQYRGKPERFAICWDIALGMADCRMDRVVDFGEI